MPKVDRRIRRTQKLLGDALIELVLEKDYDAITIKDITERADVAYVTFFRHYNDKDELLVKRMEDTISELMAHMEAAIDPQSERCGLLKGEIIFQHAAQNAELYGILLGSPGAARVRRRIHESMATMMLESDELSPDAVVPPEIAANHCSASLLALIQWWLEHDRPYPPAQMAAIYDRLIEQLPQGAISPDFS